MDLKRLTVSALAAVFALSGIGSILLINHQPRAVEAVELSDDDRDPGFRRQDDDGFVLEVVDDDDRGDGDDTAGDDGTNRGANTGDGDDTAGDDGTNGGNNTGDGDDTAGDDDTSGGSNTADNTNTGGDTRGGDTTD